MPLITPKLLFQMKEIIAKHHTALVAKMFGHDTVPEKVLETLKAAGLIDKNASGIEDAYLYGHAVAVAANPAMSSWTAAQLKDYVTKNPVPLTPVEQASVQAAKLSAAQYVVGLGNVVEKETGQLLIEADHKLRAKLKEDIVDETMKKIEARKTVKELKSDLGHRTEDWTRNLDRIAITETHNAMQLGVAQGLAKKYGDPRVAIIPMPDACADCKRLHLGPDGKPRIFKLSQLAAPGANVKKPKSAWVASTGAVHPHCQCQLTRVPAGWGFDKDGTMVPGGTYGVEVTEKSFAVLLQHEADHLDRLEKAHRLKGRMEYDGLLIAIEQEVGDERQWRDRNGETGTTTMLWPYGFIEGTKGADGEAIDCYVGPNPEAPNVYVVDQKKKLGDGQFGGFDEQKCMLGFSSADEAREAYLAHYNDPGFLGAMRTIPFDDFKRRVMQEQAEVVLKSAQLEAARETFVILEKAAGPFIGPRGGKWADAARTIPWVESEHGSKRTGAVAVPEGQVHAITDAITSGFQTDKRGQVRGLGPTKSTTVEVATADGKVLRTTVTLASDPLMQDPRGIRGEANLRTRSDGVTANVENAVVTIHVKPGDAFAGFHDETELKQKIRSVLAHELTHVADPTLHASQRAKAIALIGGSARDHNAGTNDHGGQAERYHAYVNEKTEVTARIQQILRDVLDEKSVATLQAAYDDHKADPENPPPYRPEQVVEWSPTWERVQEQLTPENRKRVLTAVATTLDGIHHRRLQPVKKSSPYDVLHIVLEKAGPYIGPQGGKYADPAHKVAWREGHHAETTEDGVHFQTGKPVDVKYTHRKQPTQNFGARFGQDIEPAGRYVLHGHLGTPGESVEAGNFKVTTTHGTVHFQNPLVIVHGGTTGEPGAWKRRLSGEHGGKKGKALSKAIAKQGHDGIVTVDKHGTSEIVDLTHLHVQKSMRYSEVSEADHGEVDGGGAMLAANAPMQPSYLPDVEEARFMLTDTTTPPGITMFQGKGTWERPDDQPAQRFLLTLDTGAGQAADFKDADLDVSGNHEAVEAYVERERGGSPVASIESGRVRKGPTLADA